MNAPQQIETSQPTPEQLLRLLELQLAGERSKREARPRKRAMILVFGMLAIVVLAGLALMIAQQMLVDLHDRGAMPPTPVPPAVVEEKL